MSAAQIPAPAAAAPALQAAGLRVSFPAPPSAAAARTPVVDGLDLQIAAGEALALVGESGSGKSLSALALMRLVPRPGRTDAGSVRLAGRELLPLPVPAMRAVRGGELSMIFQEPMTSLSPVSTVGDQVVEAIRLHERVSRRAARARTAALFARVGIPEPTQRLDAYPHQLSGGMKQRVSIAMAIAAQPSVLIADEPTTALDVTIQAQILELLRELQRELGTAILLITHDLGIVNELADRVAVMYAGRIVEEARREDLLAAPRHPYTRGLLRSMPALARPGERLAEIPGVVPPPAEWPAGCRFATRCAERFEPCGEQVPEATQVGPLHRAFCFAVERQQAAPPPANVTAAPAEAASAATSEGAPKVAEPASATAPESAVEAEKPARTTAPGSAPEAEAAEPARSVTSGAAHEAAEPARSAESGAAHEAEPARPAESGVAPEAVDAAAKRAAEEGA